MRHSLRRKAVFLIILIMLLITAAGIFASVKAINDIIRNSYENRATEAAQTAASVIDTEVLERFQQKTDEIFASLKDNQRVGSEEWGSDAFNAYQARYEELYKTEEYQTLLDQLQKVQDANDVDCLYTTYVDPKTESFIYLVDADHGDPCPIGCFDPIYEENQAVLTNPSRGFPAYVTNTPEYGHLVTAGVPVYNDKLEVIAYSLADISMNDMIAWRNRMIGIMLSIQLALTILIGIFAGIAVNRAVVRPINELSRASEEYCQESDLTNHTRFAALDINTGDEIETLSNSMKQMEQDLNGKIADLLDTTDRLAKTRREADELNILAKKDSMTGVYNKRSFDEALQRLDQTLLQNTEEPFALAIVDLNDLKKINDTYGHEQGDAAITSLCRNICQVFVHSPVYRIGGDEFAVILQGQDLGRIDELMTGFNSRLAALQQNADLRPWEKVGAAIGYARFNPDRDDDASATFRRADQAMYERKEAMKNGRG